MRKFLFSNNQVITKEPGKADVVRRVDEQQRAYAALEIKEFDDRKRTFKGIASSSTPDRMEDVVEPKGAAVKLPLAFLYQHDSGKPVGWVERWKTVGDRIEVEGRLEVPDADAPQTISDRLNTAWYELKKKLVRGLSIGFNPKKYAFIKETGGIHFLEIEVLELSMVTIPANAEATITSIKSFARAAPGPSNPPARAGATPAVNSTKGNTMKYTAQALADLRKQRETEQGRIAELLELKKTEGREFTEEERTEFDNLKKSIPDLDDEISVCEFYVNDAKTAKPLGEREPQQQRSAYGFVKKQDPDDKFKGQAFTRNLIAKAMAYLEFKKGNFGVRPSDVAQYRWGKSHPNLVAYIKANEVAGGGSGSGEWGAELVSADNRYRGDFIDFLYNMTVYDRLPLRRVPANIAIKGQDGAFTGYWVGESKPIPVSAGDFSSVSLTPLKVAALCVVSNEWIRDSDPSGELLVRDGLGKAHEQRVDSTFISASAASAGVSPAGILNGVSAKTSNGGDAQSVMTDWRALIADFITAKNVKGLYVVTTPTLAEGLGTMRNALGADEFPGITAEGGTFRGRPVLTGDNVGAGDFILLDPAEIYRIGDMGVEIELSTEAAIEQNSAPTGATDTPVGVSQAWTSMFQAYSTAFRLTRSINFAKRRSAAVAYVGDAAYGTETSNA